ncbi:MAG: heparan-alpha-glucosaminide N-acetyltransferase domain-containing protein [Verrucomicrobiota bacterium]
MNQPTVREPSSTAQRLLSLDALRGFDMFWIVGAEDIVHALRKISDSGFVNLLANQMDHKPWRGVAFYDLIFPLFVFIVGVSLVFSLSKTIAQYGRAAAFKRVLIRGALLYLIGIFYYGGIAGGIEQVRLLGVLQRIALCYLFASLIFCTMKPRAMVACCASLLLGYWALMALVPIRDINIEKNSITQLMAQTGTTDADALFFSTTNRVAGRFDEGLNLANHLDFQYLPYRKWDGNYDPEGLLSTLPAIATCLLGVFSGLLLRNGAVPNQKKVIYLIASGMASVLVGFLWGAKFPVIKKIWSSSYVLVAGGYGCIFLGVFYQVIELWKFQRWAQPFVWIGVNPIAIYLAHNLIDFPRLAERLVGGPVRAAAGVYSNLIVTIVVMSMSFLLAYFLYKRKIFIRL